MQTDQIDSATMKKEIANAIRHNLLDDAESKLQQLYEIDPSAREQLIFPAIIAIQRGNVLDVLQHINSLPEDRCPEIKAICLNLLGDPTWHAYALALEDSPDPFIRKAMRQLLERPDDSATH
ncbi:MAG: HrpB1 family type III secretion system apparatus protein [Pseudomonadota bacterium]